MSRPGFYFPDFAEYQKKYINENYDIASVTDKAFCEEDNRHYFALREYPEVPGLWQNI